MKRERKYLLLMLLFVTFIVERANAQYMPVVYDNTYGKESAFTKGTTLANGDVVMVGNKGDKALVTWLDRLGNVRMSKSFNDGFTRIRNVVAMADGKIMLLGESEATTQRGEAVGSAGRALLLTPNGRVERDIKIGKRGSYLTNGITLDGGVIMLSGSEGSLADGGKGFIAKIDAKDRVLYDYVSSLGGECLRFDVLGSAHNEFVQAAFSGGGSGSSVVRLDEKGKPFYVTQILDSTFNIESMISTMDGYMVLTGSSNSLGGVVVKVRPEGDVVFQKQIVPASTGATLPYLMLGNGGEILVGGSGSEQGFYALLRSDGTELSSNVAGGEVAGLYLNKHSGESVVSLYNASKNAGWVVKLSDIGRKLYEKSVSSKYTKIQVDNLGYALLGSVDAGRLTMFSGFGELMFDRFVQESGPAQYSEILYASNGDVIFNGQTNRVVKLAYGIHVSDVTVNKPINGFATAVFTVTLSGYSTNVMGAPVPVTVQYSTAGKTAGADNFIPAQGTLSFIPSVDGSERFLQKQVIEIPIKANDYLEGRREFEVLLADVQNSYLIKGSALGTIEDQQAVVRMTGTQDGVEGSRDVLYTLGIFKTNGTPLTNRTGADIVVDGIYAGGTADAQDYDNGRIPRVKILNGSHDGIYNVVTRSNTRFELPRTVVIDFNKIYALSDASISFSSSVLSCQGFIIDQPAQVMMASLGDHGRLNNSVSGFFKFSLVRASDGALLTNNSGGDIVIDAVLNDTTTAEMGKDFVLTNQYDLRIWGDSRQSAVNLTGVILYNNDKTPKTVAVKIAGVKVPDGANPLTIVAEKGSAAFQIKQ